MKKLSKKEEAELKGGQYISVSMGISGVENLNKSTDCHCIYNDTSAVDNTNKVTTCKCTCN